MMTPPLGPEPGPFLMPPEPPQEGGFFMGEQDSSQQYATVITLPEEDQQEIIRLCRELKTGLINSASDKKKQMERSYAYYQGQFSGKNELLPRPKVEGTENSVGADRPQIFMPVARQQAKQLYSLLKMTLLPNDEDFFRIRAKSAKPLPPQFQPQDVQLAMLAQSLTQQNPLAVQAPAVQKGLALSLQVKPLTYTDIEDDLTEAIKQKFKKDLISEKMGELLLDLVWSGNGVAYPCLQEKITAKWKTNPDTKSIEPVETRTTEVVLNVWNPLNFYPDPFANDSQSFKWGYFTQGPRQALLDNPSIINRDRLLKEENLQNRDTQNANQQGNSGLSTYNKLNSQQNDVEPHVDIDIFYFPHINLKNQTLRNILFVIANGNILVEIKPNMAASGKPPVVFATWAKDKGTPYGTGPIDDLAELQRLINILQNYNIETLARIGNQYIAGPDVDLKTLFGMAGGVARGRVDDLKVITGNYAEPQFIQNAIGVLKAEAQQVSGASNTFQGAAEVDTTKTATEIQINAEKGISVQREITEHIASTGVQQVLDRLILLYAETATAPVSIRVTEAMGGSRFSDVDLRVLLPDETGETPFELDLVSINPSQSKNAQAESLMRFAEVAMSNPMAIEILAPIWEKLGALNGIRDIPELINDIKERMIYAQQQAVQNPNGGDPETPEPSPDPNGAVDDAS